MRWQDPQIAEVATNRARKNPASDARFCLFDTEIDAVADALRGDLGDMPFAIEFRSAEELMPMLLSRRFISDERSAPPTRWWRR
ncbi:hypothetical protein [Rhizobium ruizarguesonis]|uniref:hypothetical protein n=1 Tax=Rhizobium ruizarguesonis TaxID=2081791 RepID=UPI0013C04921|nr:hypothetical protein [Rhizobium ruizarguesonis]NEH32631.1 hypothetical protein [Rhizobium ruizarguesonis]NEK07451.1 hypothetical protein [Rhizobium ruizarguesonis]